MHDPLAPETVRRLGAVGRRTAGLELLLLYGSRARGAARPDADWDLGYLGDQVEPGALLAELVEAMETDRIDLANLARATGVLRYHAARDGIVVFELVPGVADDFRLEAVRFWCEAGPLLERGYDAVLSELRR